METRVERLSARTPVERRSRLVEADGSERAPDRPELEERLRMTRFHRVADGADTGSSRAKASFVPGPRSEIVGGRQVERHAPSPRGGGERRPLRVYAAVIREDHALVRHGRGGARIRPQAEA